jgi:hypothetical protein
MASQRKAARSKRTPAPGPTTYDTVVRVARQFPGIEESTSYGTPALKVRGTLLARLWEDGETLVLRTTFVDRDLLLQTHPKIYFLTDHYKDYQWVLVRLAHIRPPELRDRLEEAWRRIAPKRMIAAFDASEKL